MSVQMEDKAEAEVHAFLDLYGWALHDPLPEELLPRSKAAEVHVRLSCASIAKGDEKRQHYEDIAAEMLDKLLSDAEKDPTAFKACGELIHMLADDSLPIPDNLSRFAADILRGEKTATKKPKRTKHENLGRDSIIVECIFIAAGYVRPVYKSNGHITAVDVVSRCLKKHGVHLEPNSIARILQNTPDSHRKCEMLEGKD